MTNNNLQRGQSLFELVVAIAISALMVVAMVSLATNSIKNSNFAKNKALASTYAQQATEWLRGQRDSDIGIFIVNVTDNTVSKRCLNNLTWTIAACASGSTITNTPFQRDVIFNITYDVINGVNKEILNADITVSWTDSGGLHKVVSATSFSDWRQR
ncbi:MAG: prepilin-type N-terminal cleavage/methylation domain-containing protein [Candidatus Woesebacteria bacterium]|nr:prepilin-type N-terminal cleavage/methylation domain-containing protein [Candidatus Woesebacteria bacterium]